MVALEELGHTLLQELTGRFPERRVLGAWLYGSQARGEARADSDLDIAVLCDEPLDPVGLFDAGGRLTSRLGTVVDLVDLRQAGGLLRVEATHHGRPLVPAGFEADLFTTHALADHAAFARHRRRATRAFEEKLRADDVIVQELASIDRCLASVSRYVAGDPGRLADAMVLDAVVLNLQRACELAIDAACREVSRRGLGVPADSGDAFTILERAAILSGAVTERMRRMVGFRNIAVHEYRRLDPAIVRTVVEHRLVDFADLARQLLATAEVRDVPPRSE